MSDVSHSLRITGDVTHLSYVSGVTCIRPSQRDRRMFPSNPEGHTSLAVLNEEQRPIANNSLNEFFDFATQVLHNAILVYLKNSHKKQSQSIDAM